MSSETMSDNTPDPEYRNYSMPPEELNRIAPGNLNSTSAKPKRPLVLVNGKIRAREVRVIGEHGLQIGVMPLTSALALAKAAKLDLIQITRKIEPPVCRIVELGKHRHKLSKQAE